MAFDTNMVYVRWEFNFNVDSEIQVFGMWGHIDKSGIEPFPDWQDLVDSLATKAVETWISDGPSPGKFSPSLQGRRVVVYHYDQPLKQVLNRAEAAFSGSNTWSGSSSNGLPAQDTLVCSLYAYDPAGYVPDRSSKRGRVYLPTPGTSQVDGTGRLTTANQTAWADAMAAFITEMKQPFTPSGASATVSFNPQVVSRAKEINTDVQIIRVGLIIDTQRRRRNKEAEDYADRDVS